MAGSISLTSGRTTFFVTFVDHFDIHVYETLTIAFNPYFIRFKKREGAFEKENAEEMCFI